MKFDPQKFAAETLTGDIRDAILSEFRLMPKPWQHMKEDEQQRLIHRADDIADTIVRRAVDLIAARDLPALPIEVGKIIVEGPGCKGTFECYADDDSLLRIRHLQGKRAMFVLASPDAYAGETNEAKPDVIGDLRIPDPQGHAAEAIGAALAASGNGHAADGLDIPTELRRT